MNCTTSNNGLNSFYFIYLIMSLPHSKKKRGKKMNNYIRNVVDCHTIGTINRTRSTTHTQDSRQPNQKLIHVLIIEKTYKFRM